MGKVASPRGPLPARVYWRRRLVLLAVVVALVGLVAWVLPGGDETQPAARTTSAEPTARADRPGAVPSARPRAGSGTPPDARQGQQRADSRREARRRERQPERRQEGRSTSAELTGAQSPLAQPEGSCQEADVRIVADVEDTDATRPVPLRLGLTTTGPRACTFAFGPDAVAVQVTSGDDLIWESVDCPRALEEQSVAVRPGWLSYVTVDWSGRRGDDGCAAAGPFADPGFYWAEAAALGGEPDRSQFELETPPPPKKPKTDRSDRRDDERRQQRAADQGRRAEGSEEAPRSERESPQRQRGRQQEQESGTGQDPDRQRDGRRHGQRDGQRDDADSGDATDSADRSG
jgi:hypothetical protein